MDSFLLKLLPLRARRTMFLLALTASLGGLQGIFSVQMAMGSPYLLSLGFTKPLMALVWLAGPLAGVIGQPYFGLVSDQSHLSWGRRKPFIAGGAILMALSLLGLAWVKEILRLVSWILEINTDRDLLQTTTLTAAAIFVWVLNFAIQPLQGGLRALIVDSNPPDQMDAANAWASRMVSAGSLIGYGSGFFDLPRLLYDAKGSKFQRLSVFAVIGLAFAVSMCCTLVKECDPNEDGPPKRELRSMTGKVKHIYKAMSSLHPSMAQVFKVQFCSWVGWFSFLYYISTYISQIYIRNNGGIDLRDQQHNFMEVQAEAHRQGSLSLLLFASIQFLTTLIAPYLVRDSKCDRLHPTTKLRLINRFFSNHFRDQWISLRTLWICSHSIFAICMFSTIFVTRTETAIVLIGITGISMALTQFVPFALLGIILSRHEKDIESEGLIEKGKSTPYGQNSGIVMGLHNVVIAAPQVIAALTSSAMFRILGGIRSKNGLTAAGEDIKSIGLVLSTGGITALLAIYMTLKVREETIVGPVFVLTEMEEDDEDEEAEEKSYRSLSTSYMASIGREASLDDLSTGMDL